MPASSASPSDPQIGSTTLSEHLRGAAYRVNGDTGLSVVINAIAGAAVAIEGQTRLAALAGVLGDTGEINVQQELVQRLDAIGTESFVEALRACGRVAALACEELEEMVHISDAADHEYLTVFDPVDGSSNIDVAVTIGSIFGIYRRADASPVTAETLLRPGHEQVAAVYAIYGSSTVFVVAVRDQVDGFTLNPTSGEFVLTHPDIRIPETCKYYSINEHYQERWEPGVQRAVALLRQKYGQRYVGSLVADFHRDLLKGGVFLYPGEVKNPQGKLRLGYEANPLGFVAEQAGGAASDGRRRILDLQPEKLHQRTPLIVGNADVVREVEAIIAAGG